MRDPAEIERILRDALPRPPTAGELAEVTAMVARQEELAALLRELPLEEEEQGLPPSLEGGS